MTNSDSPTHVAPCDQFTISTDKAKLNLDVVHGYLSTAYWSPGISIQQIKRSIEYSFCFGVYGPEDQQVGFARVVTDFVTSAYLADVFILDKFSGQGLGKRLVETIVTHPDLQGIRRFLLFTRDAHDLYANYGFAPLNDAENCMQIYRGISFKANTDGTDVSTTAATTSFAQRRTEMIGVEEINGWHLKVYSISASGEILPSVIQGAAIQFLRKQFAWPVSLNPGYGFITIHLGLDAVWLLTDLWAEDILHHFIFNAPLNNPARFSPATDGTIACVWELEVTKHERDAWVNHVLSQPANRDYTRYLKDSVIIPRPLSSPN